MKFLCHILLYLLGLMVLGACVTNPDDNVRDVPVETLTEFESSNQGSGASNTRKYSMTRVNNIHRDSFTYQKLMSQYREWKGVPYRMGGMSKQGVDCSGFIQTTFRSKLGINIPRSTELLSQAGKEVKKTELKTGDLVFFKTSYKVRHVGVYLDDGNFMHASTSRGVMISNLSNVYWNGKYWKAVRIPQISGI